MHRLTTVLLAHEFNSLNKGAAEPIEGYFASVFKAEFYCYFAVCGNSAGKACFEISLQKAFPVFPFNTGVYSLNKGTAEQIEGYFASVFKAEFHCSFAVCGNTAGKACFEISLQKAFPDFPFNSGAEFYWYFVICGNAAVKACLRSLHTKRFHTSPSTHEFNSLNKRTAEQIEGYVCSVFKAEFYCYFVICRNTAGKACFEISLQKAFPDFPSAHEFNSAEFYCYFLNKCKAEQSFTAISLYSGILIKRPLNQGTAEQIEGYDSSLNICKAERQNSSAISLYVGILLERPLNK
ncbi:hypothetical protein P7K49_040458 [Saguinus oedipus]|uniref:Uncharacterized protein n=1 Tax=Saguinus oedipus TaxID=9490 RepID=A0ABQ9TAZ2_SAGOE|nr:hypothetical protein P7K49_040458 [Saguinus oedipus]